MSLSDTHIHMQNEDMRILIAPGYVRDTLTQPLSPNDTPVTTGTHTHTVDCSSLHVILLTVESVHALVCSAQEADPYLTRKYKYMASWISPLLLTWVCFKQQNDFFLLYVVTLVLRPPRQTKSCIFPSAFRVEVCTSVCLHMLTWRLHAHVSPAFCEVP